MTDDVAPPPEPSTPGSSAPAPPDRWRWARRLVQLVLLLGAAAFAVYAFGRAPDHAETGPLHDAAVLQQVPAPGANVLRQTQVGAKLKPGYTGLIIVNGTQIPEDQMDGAVPTTSKEYDPRFGVRPNNKELVFFTPGPGKVISRFGSREVTITVRFWPIADGEGAAQSVTWTIYVS